MIWAKDLNVQRFLGLDSLPDQFDTTVELILTGTQSKKKHFYASLKSIWGVPRENIEKVKDFDILLCSCIKTETSVWVRIILPPESYKRSLHLRRNCREPLLSTGSLYEKILK